ncbi:TonB-dependent receptor plug domain-containing protein [Rhodospirillum centenum]|uniref:TonB-dependent receptor plug domain-containing protein n=1 Tax=Rhodospirillum centenum TaxID=34018 RepID=UPI0002DEF459|nr:TonB-dependent receptor plug domain-containing protein [Rhodospirillum centenum]
MRNGVPYNVFSDTANIQQIDVVKGANSILYGFNDPGGLINYITRAPQEAAYSVSRPSAPSTITGPRPMRPARCSATRATA